MDEDAIERARKRLAALEADRPSQPELEAALERAREQLESFAEVTAELQTKVPERVGAAIQDAVRDEVIPVGRHIAEVRGLSAQTIRRLERLQGDLEAERKVHVEDLALLVDLIASGWRSVERRLDRLERVLDRLERASEGRQGASLFRLEERQERRPGA